MIKFSQPFLIQSETTGFPPHYFSSYKYTEVSFLKCSLQMMSLHYQRLISNQRNRMVVGNHISCLFDGTTCKLCLIVLYFVLMSKTAQDVFYFSLLLHKTHKPCFLVFCLFVCFFFIQCEENITCERNIRLVKFFAESRSLYNLEPQMYKNSYLIILFIGMNQEMILIPMVYYNCYQCSQLGW